MLAYRVIIIENACGQQSTVCVEFQARTQGGGWWVRTNFFYNNNNNNNNSQR